MVPGLPGWEEGKDREWEWGLHGEGGEGEGRSLGSQREVDGVGEKGAAVGVEDPKRLREELTEAQRCGAGRCGRTDLLVRSGGRARGQGEGRAGRKRGVAHVVL